MNKHCVNYLDKNIPFLVGKTYIVTGSTSGVGEEAIKELAYKGAKVIFLCRNKEKLLKSLERIENELGRKFDYNYYLYNQSDLESIKKVVTLIEEQVDGVILNAGIYWPKPGSVSEDNSSLTFFTNVVGTYFLYKGLREKFPTADFNFVTSIYKNKPKKNDYSPFIKNGEFKKRGLEYSISKRCVFLLHIYAKMIYKDNTSLSHPGITNTNIFSNFAPKLRTLGQKFLYLFTHHPWKAALCEVEAVVKNSSFYVPRGLFEISGYPRLKKIKYEKYLSDAKVLVDYLESTYKDKN